MSPHRTFFAAVCLFVCLFASGRAVRLFVFVCVRSSRCLVGTPPARQNVKIVADFRGLRGVVAAPQ